MSGRLKFRADYLFGTKRNAFNDTIVAAMALATYLIPGCVGRGVRLGSENSSGGGVWKSGNLEIWKFGNLGPGNLGIQKPGDLKIQKFGVQNIKNIKILKIQIRSAQNVGKVWISRKKSSWPYLGPSEAIFSIGRKIQKTMKNTYFPWWANGPLFTRDGPLLLSTRGGAIGNCWFIWLVGARWFWADERRPLWKV